MMTETYNVNILKIPIHKDIMLGDLNRRALYEGMDIIIDNGKAYATIEIFKKYDFIQR